MGGSRRTRRRKELNAAQHGSAAASSESLSESSSSESSSESSSAESSEFSSSASSSSREAARRKRRKITTAKSSSYDNEKQRFIVKTEKNLLSELDAKIAALEAALDKDTSSSSDADSSSEVDESDIDERQGWQGETGRGQDEEELEAIPSLPAHLLPAPGVSKRVVPEVPADAGAKKLDDKSEDKSKLKDIAPDKLFECDACRGFSCFGKINWKKHTRTLLHRQNTVLAAGAAYEPARKRPLYCRACGVQFQSVEEMHRHRGTDAHRDMVQKERRASFCQVCRKQFTSAVQLQEHIKGRQHKEILASRAGGAAPPCR